MRREREQKRNDENRENCSVISKAPALTINFSDLFQKMLLLWLSGYIALSKAKSEWEAETDIF